MDPQVRLDYRAQLAEFRLVYSRTGCAVGCALVAGGAALDLAFYPQQAAQLGLVRGATTAFMLLLLGVLFTGFARRHARTLTLLWLIMPQLMI